MSARTFRSIDVDDELALTQAALLLRRAYPTFVTSGIYETDKLVERTRTRMKGRYQFHGVFEEGRPSSANLAELVLKSRAKKAEQANKEETNEPVANEYATAKSADHGVMVGLWAHMKFDVMYYGITTPVGGLSSVAADFLNKKRGLAHDLVKQFLYDARGRGEPLTALYAFRPDFYGSMGFGNSATVSEHALAPTAFPKASTSVKERYRTEILPVRLDGAPEDTYLEALRECYEIFSRGRHGLFVRNAEDFAKMSGFGDPELQYIGFVDTQAETSTDSQLRLAGYIIFKIVPARSPSGSVTFTQDIRVAEYAYLNPNVLLAICAFLRSQADQVRSVILVSMTGPDEVLQLCAEQDNRDRVGIERNGEAVGVLGHNGGTVGYGFMVRIVNFQKLLDCWAEREYDVRGLSKAFQGRTSWTVAVTCKDPLVPENDGTVSIRFDGDGKAKVLDSDSKDAVDVSLALAVKDLSSMMVGTLTIKQLHRLGLASVEPESAVAAVSKLFAAEEKPVCLNYF
ncbi:sterol carrier protein domain-containing protein [Cladochytrium replicatum]|nr:sterol carrier protein domain-containing protein [Cladochytrium replicatum]